MSQILGTVVAAPITTGDTTLTFSIGDTAEMQGGFRSVADTTARDAIDPLRRTEGMIVWVIDIVTGFQLIGGITNSDWVTWSPGSVTSATAPLTLTSGVLAIPQASGSQNGFLDSTDWTTFNTGATEAAAALPAASFSSAFASAFATETTDGLSEGATNLYYTNTRARNAVSATTPLNYVSSTGVFSIPQASGSQNGFLDSADWTTFNTGATEAAAALPAASFASAFASAFAAETTDSLIEGATNLYYTNARARNAVSATTPLNYVSSTGVFSIPQASGSQNGFLDSTDWTTFNTGATEAAAALPAVKQTKSIVLCSAYTPLAVGADTAEVEIPYDTTGASLTFSIKRILLRVQAAGGAPSVAFELYAGTGAFSATAIGTVTLSSGAFEGQVTTGLGTIASGSKIRFNVLTLATAQNWTVQADISAN